MAVGVIDLEPLLEVLHKLSEGRFVRAAEIVQEGEFTRARIPVCRVNPGDKTDQALRRYASDWIKLQRKNTAADTKFEPLPPGQSYYKDGVEHRLCAVLHLSWWPRPELPDYEQIKEMQRARRGTDPNA